MIINVDFGYSTEFMEYLDEEAQKHYIETMPDTIIDTMKPAIREKLIITEKKIMMQGSLEKKASICILTPEQAEHLLMLTNHLDKRIKDKIKSIIYS